MPPKTKSEPEPAADDNTPDAADESIDDAPAYDPLADDVAALRVEVAEIRARLDTMAPQSGGAGNPARFRMSEGEWLDRIERERTAARPAD